MELILVNSLRTLRLAFFLNDYLQVELLWSRFEVALFLDRLKVRHELFVWLEDFCEFWLEPILHVEIDGSCAEIGQNQL